jgi:hypothetical protein
LFACKMSVPGQPQPATLLINNDIYFSQKNQDLDSVIE